MTILERLFGSPARVRLMRLFYLNPDKIVTSKEAAKMSKLSFGAVSKEKIFGVSGKTKIEKAKTSRGEIRLEGIFVAIGKATALAFANKLALQTKEDYLIVDRDGKTSEDGVYAAGGCTGGNYQMAVSVGEGANAAISAIKKIKCLPMYSDLT